LAAGCAAASPQPPPSPAAVSIPPVVASTTAAPTTTTAAPSPPKAPPKYEALIAALDASSGAKGEIALKKTFLDLRALGDPRAADGLARFLAKDALAPRWKTQAALALAELADLRAVPALAWRLKHSPLTLYSDKEDHEIELRRDDSERVACARNIADLLRLHPDHRDEIAKASEENLFLWAASHPEPHANAMRALAWIGSAKAKAKLRAWADPTTPLPAAGANMFPPAFSIAQSGNRYLGVAWRDAPDTDPGKRDAFAILKKNIARRPDKSDISMNALMQGGIAVQGMSLRALAIGAAMGLLELGDPKGVDLLVKHIEDEKNNEASRTEACNDLGLLAPAAELRTLVSKKTPSDFARRCYLEAVTRRADASIATRLLPLLKKSTDESLRFSVATAIGAAPLGPPSTTTMQTLNGMLSDPDLRAQAALAMLLGGDLSTQGAKDVCARIEIKEDRFLRAIEQSVSVIYERDLDEGNLARRVRNATACGGEVKSIMERGIRGVEFDQGPHSLTLVLFRARLIAAAKQSKDPNKRGEVEAILRALGADATIDALGL